MDFETLLFRLHQHRESVAEKLDQSLCDEMISHIEAAGSSGKVSKDFFFFCGKHLAEFVKSERLGSKDKGRLTPADVEKFTNELVRSLKHPKPEAEGKKKR